MQTPTPKRKTRKSGPLFALASALFAIDGLMNLFAQYRVFAAMFLALGFL